MTGHHSALLEATRSISPPHGVSILSGPPRGFKHFATQSVQMGASEPERKREREGENGYRSQAMCPFCHLTPSTTAWPSLLSEGLQGHCPLWLLPEPLFHRYCYYFSSVQSLSCVQLFAPSHPPLSPSPPAPNPSQH